MQNPFKFGTIVDGPHFANRVKELEEVVSLLQSSNHLILMGPRRFGKTSLIFKAARTTGRPLLFLNVQMTTSEEDLAAQLLKRVFELFPVEKLKDRLRSFRIVPSMTYQPVSQTYDVAFTPSAKGDARPLEDTLNLLEELGREKVRPVVILDEFQEIIRLSGQLPKVLRSIMQHHQHLNYVLLGSQESLLRDLFEKKRSPFYHFGYLMTINRIPREEFAPFLAVRFAERTPFGNPAADAVLDITRAHPYYTQQMAFVVWEKLRDQPFSETLIQESVQQLINMRDLDYDRIWTALNTTDRKMLIGLAERRFSPTSGAFLQRYGFPSTSTAYSSLKRLLRSGILLQLPDGYSVDDPFFEKWYLLKRGNTDT